MVPNPSIDSDGSHMASSKQSQKQSDNSAEIVLLSCVSVTAKHWVTSNESNRKLQLIVIIFSPCMIIEFYGFLLEVE